MPPGLELFFSKILGKWRKEKGFQRTRGKKRKGVATSREKMLSNMEDRMSGRGNKKLVAGGSTRG